MNFLPWSRFLIIVSSPACIENKKHFRTHRDQILIGSLVNSKQVNGGALQKETLTAAARVRWLSPTPTPKKTRRICINLRNGLWQKWGGHVHPSPPRGDAPECHLVLNINPLLTAYDLILLLVIFPAVCDSGFLF